MVWSIRSLVGSLLGQGGSEPAPMSAEVALDTFALECVDPRLARKLFQGQELELAAGEGGRLEARAAGRKGALTAGTVPPERAGRLAELLERGARLGCRVVLAEADRQDAPLVRVRVSVLM
ncbi:hypothetical protein [Fundidesulfovibrio soli]|uniref:hypothetical protein n=1 Tax=Fundidesulfovibrio soli TaxID=2922716 RepID=UPI001FAF7F0D|nr:hypothetical protein [Fundidesulfovibrio soli]